MKKRKIEEGRKRKGDRVKKGGRKGKKHTCRFFKLEF